MDTVNLPQKNILRYLRWRDLIVVIAGLALGWWISNGFSFHTPTDYEKWRVRPQLPPIERPRTGEKLGQSGLAPCLFIVPKGVTDQPFLSGSVGDCLRLVPDGTKLDVFEIPLEGGFLHIKTDLYVPDVIPLAFTRCVVPIDDFSKQHKIYLPHVYDPFLMGDRVPYTYLSWILPDRQVVHYQRVSRGTGYADAVYEARSGDQIFAGSRVAWNGFGWDLSLENGTTLLSPEAYSATRPQQGSLVGIFDEQGREVQLARKSNGDLTKVVSPSGSWIKFSYDGGRLIEVEDSLGNTSKYTYDAENRLVRVTHSAGSGIQYSYDSANRIVQIEDSLSGSVLKNKYGLTGSVEQTAVDGETYSIRYLVDDVDITGPKGVVTRVHLAEQNSNTMYTIEKVGH